MHDPMTVAFQIGKHGQLCTIWHNDPETDGTDDSCGWCMRARHGDSAVLEDIVKAFDFEWGQKPGSQYNTWFNMDGSTRMSRQGIVLDMFYKGAYRYFRHDWKKAKRWVQRHIAEILHFAENNIDSLGDGFKYYVLYPKDYTREERIQQCAGCVYAWILNCERPWYRHPRWHIWHWHVQFPWLRDFKRWAFSRCAGCGRRFAYGYAPTSFQWHSDGPRWFRGESDKYHHECADRKMQNPPAAKEVDHD